MRIRFPQTILLIATFILGGAGSAQADEIDLFKSAVLPILQSRCVSCHNSIDRNGELSLQTREELMASGYVEPNDPNSSQLLDALVSHNGQPPSMPKSGKPLVTEELTAIREWIQQGANWPEGISVEQPVVNNTDWWSFKPLSKPEIPESIPDQESQAVDSPPSNPIDRFIFKSHAQQKLTRSRRAAPQVLIRRLYYDLTGLPPTPKEVEDFVKDVHCEPAGTKPSAYERLVDRLLASPHYGERWARHWLDVVKYADTCGYDKDKLRPNAWPYRDYVIRSFNDDKPYSRFVQEQVAGDVLFPGTPDGILGLGFIAAGPWDFIGHAEIPESKIDGKIARHTDRDEMVSNTLNTFCSVTIQCCQCHNHKFDPFTQEHYYNLQSVFAAVDRAERAYDLDPQVERQRRTLSEQLQAARQSLSKLQDDISLDAGPELASLEMQIAELKPKVLPTNARPQFGYHSSISKDQDAEKWVQVDLGTEVDISRIVLHPCYDDFNQIGAGFGFPIRFKVTVEGVAGKQQLLHEITTQDLVNPGLNLFEVAIENTMARVIRITATKLAPRKEDFIFALAELQVFDPAGKNVALQSKVTAFDSIEAPERWRMANLTDGIWTEAADEEVGRALMMAQNKHQAILSRVMTAARIAERERLNQSIAAYQTELSSLPPGKLVYAAATHFTPNGSFQPTNGKPREIHLLHRGNVNQPLTTSVPGTLPLPMSEGEAEQLSNAGHFLLPPNHAESDRRAALARWITSHEHPLTWRSIVNRIWQHHFGRGLVETPNDFGRMGQPPTHPELLDWLAMEFRDNGQSFKRLHQLIVTSETYQQSSDHNESNSLIDSDNRFLWRANRRRLQAEEIRDSILAVSGKLNPTMGGPGFYLFVLERPEHSPHYQYHKFDPNEATSHRRSIYRFVVRSQPDPYMTTLDCADSSQSTPLRNETLTSLQALSLLNNSFSLAMAKHFAARVETQYGSTVEQLNFAFQTVAGRKPNSEELVEMSDYVDVHGLPNLCRVLLNLSEFVYID